MKTLGCAEKYTATIEYMAATSNPRPRSLLAQIAKPVSVSWERRLDEPSEATVVVPKTSLDPDCCRKLGLLRPWQFEMSVWRDNDLVWQGPVYDVTFSNDGVNIVARDMLQWLEFRWNHSTWSWTGAPEDLGYASWYLIRDAVSFLTNADPLLFSYVTYETIGVTTELSPGSIGEVDTLAQLREWASSGMDITTLGRAIIIKKERNPDEYVGDPPRLSDRDFLNGNVQIRLPGADMATRVAVQGNSTAALFPPGSGGNTNFGLIERKFQSDLVVTFTDALNQAKARLGVMFPDRAEFVVVPDDSQLMPDAPVTIDRLLCGERIDIYVQNFCREITRSMKLMRVSGTWTAEVGERIGISVGPLFAPAT